MLRQTYRCGIWIVTWTCLDLRVSDSREERVEREGKRSREKKKGEWKKRERESWESQPRKKPRSPIYTTSDAQAHHLSEFEDGRCFHRGRVHKKIVAPNRSNGLTTFLLFLP